MAKINAAICDGCGQRVTGIAGVSFVYMTDKPWSDLAVPGEGVLCHSCYRLREQGLKTPNEAADVSAPVVTKELPKMAAEVVPPDDNVRDPEKPSGKGSRSRRHQPIEPEPETWVTEVTEDPFAETEKADGSEDDDGIG